VAPLSVLDNNDGWEKISLTREQIEQNLKILLDHPEFAEAMRSQYENRPEYPKAPEPEMAIYDGFLNDRDKYKVANIRNADEQELADFHPEFDDERLPELLLHYKGRNFPKTLSEQETKKWEEFRKSRLERQAAKFLEELNKFYEKDEFIGEELKLYFESLFDTEY
jgi:exodeoxyribonuclease-1